MEELSREYYEAHAGLKPTAELQPIYDATRAVLGADALELAREAFVGSAAGSEEHRAARLLLDWQRGVAEQRAQLAALDEREIAWERDAVVRLRRRPRDAVPARRRSRSRTATDRARARDDRDGARRAGGARAGADASRAARSASATSRESLGIADGYNADVRATVSGISLARACAPSATAFLARHPGDVGRDASPRSSRKATRHRRRREATRADALALFRAREFDAVLPRRRDGARPSATQVGEMGIDPTAGGPRALRHRRAGGQALARVLRAGAGARRGVPRAPPARRPDRLEHLPPRARARAALRVHARPTCRWSSAGSATTR